MQLELKGSVYSKKNPFLAKVVERYRLVKEGSNKEIIHVVVDIFGSGMEYSCGDSLGVYPTNDPQSVEELIQALGLTGEEKVSLKKIEHPLSIRQAFLHYLSLAEPTKKFLSLLLLYTASAEEKEKLNSLLDPVNNEALKDYLSSRHFIDLALEFPNAKVPIQEYVACLRPLLPRLYSIASSPKICPQRVHLTVRVLRYETNFRKRLGVASTYLSDRVLLENICLPVFVAPSHFDLPEDLSRDIIMVGPGTGVAPYRGFLQERVYSQATGRCWLFFGEEHRKTDYLYEEEFEQWQRSGQLHRISLAFSRDQNYKVYVQHKMAEHACELWQWLKNGAYFYVCGDMKHMAKDVDSMLHQIVQEQGGMTSEAAIAYVKQMKKDKRYQRDVY